jgi:predicted transport protein
MFRGIPETDTTPSLPYCRSHEMRIAYTTAGDGPLTGVLPMTLMKLEPVTLGSVDVTEKMVQKQIADDPSILGLGELELIDVERIQSRAGRLDLLLRDPETLKRYEVELQLGATDESHIIRAVEYWDIERKRYPQYKHTAVIVAEDITSRFLNVIQLFNGTIPLVALKMSAYKVGNDVALTFVKVLDEVSLGLVDEDEPVTGPATRESWEEKANPQTLKDTDELFKLVREVQPKATLKYNKHYIGIDIDGTSRNFVSFVPKKQRVVIRVKLPELNDEAKVKLDDANIHVLAYDSQFGQVGLRVDPPPSEKQRELIRELIRQAWEAYGKP